jgi:hypothetical protein
MHRGFVNVELFCIVKTQRESNLGTQPKVEPETPSPQPLPSFRGARGS